MGIIYRIIFPSGKSYIGQTINSLKDRLRYHKSSKNCVAVHGAFVKYGNNYKTEILVEINNEYLNEYEIKFISIYDTISPNGYNLSIGGNSNTIYSEEVRQKNSDSSRKYKENLPMYVQRIKYKNIIGYSVESPILPMKQFSYKNLSDEENLKLALDYYKTGKHKKLSGLPRYICRVLRKGNYIGYKVLLPNKLTTTFTSSKLTDSEKLNKAIEYIKVNEKII